jgi:alpha-N-arabinofuranosidase
MLVQAIFYPFEMFSKRRDGASLRTVLDGPTYEGAVNGSVHYADASAILGSGGQLHLFVTNRSMDEAMEVRLNVADCAIRALVNAELLTGPNAKAANSYEKDDVIRAQPYDEVMIRKGQALFKLPPLSFLATTLSLLRGA